MSKKTALFEPKKFLNLYGLDELERLKLERNPFWNRIRFETTWQLPVMAEITEHANIELIPMRLATREELGLFHDPSYIETIELFGNQGTAFASRFGLDTESCPVFPQMDQYSNYLVGSAIDAVMGVASGKYRNAFSFFGGLHHALESKAGGFCYYNDCVIAIKKYREEYPNKRVLYLDTDVHHGDGTQHAFYDDPNVMTISVHELSMGFYPGTGRAEEIGSGNGEGYNANIPLPPLTDDHEYWRVFEDVIVPLWLAYSPDFVFWDVGADAHMLDPLADLMLTNDTYNRMSKTVRQLVELSDGKLAVVGGGGYNPVSTAKIWTMVLADIAQVPLPSTLPAEWIRLCQDFDLEIKRGGWTDRPFRTEEETFVNIHRAVTDSISKVQDSLFPIHGIEK